MTHHCRLDPRRCLAILLPALLNFGCAAQSGWETQTAPADFVNGSRILAELVLVTTREEAISAGGLMEGWRSKLLEAGYMDEDIVDGSEVTAWTYCYGWNSGVSICAHHGHYVAHVPAELRGHLQGDPDNNWETSGDLVEIELTRTPSGYLVGTVVGVVRKATDWSPCRKTSLKLISETSAALATLAGVGPAQGMWIERDNLESEGWIRRPVVGAPGSAGPPISEWIKSPI
ncbi:MAG: hypothetical protein O3A63_18720 [Proteobacteria bacterium]|nr:hypothetical protein [Pseudomonadota bacterium]